MPEIIKSSRHSKITGDFAEHLILYWLSKHGFECARVDHVGLDLIARHPSQSEVMGISVKSRSRSEGSEGSYLSIPNENQTKLTAACQAFNCVPHFAIVVDEAEIANLAVEPAARRSGAGRLLLDSALGEAAARGVRTVYLEVRESNEAARSLYASRGFDEIGRRRAYYAHPREDALVLRRRLLSGDLSGGMERAQRK